MDLRDQPLLFISHKHVDHELATVVAKFVKNHTGAQVRIHVSSDPDYAGPPAGRVLNQTLRETLWQTEALILVYTSADQSWSYCMWECGVATNAASPDTNIYVLQCGDESPPVYDGSLNVRASEVKSIRRFIDQMFRQPSFFPGREKLTNYSEKDCDEFALVLHKSLMDVIRRQHRTEYRSPWPSFRLELSDEDVAAIVAATNVAQVVAIIHDKGIIGWFHPSAPALFDMAHIQLEASVATLLREGKTAEWFESCCFQIADFAANRAPVVRLMPLISGIEEHTPVVTNLRRAYGNSKTEFEVSFYNLADPRGTPVTARMVPANQMFCREIGEAGGKKLGELIDDMDKANIHRLPLLSQGVGRFVVHRSVMENFLLKQLRAKRGGEDVTLDDLLNDETARPMFAAFGVVAKKATVAEARQKMDLIANCRDLFVTETGNAVDTVLGYLTNLDLTGRARGRAIGAEA
jgi:hypothetical protein